MKTLMKMSVLSGLFALGLSTISNEANAGSYAVLDSQYLSIGAEYLDMSVDRFEISGGSPSIVVGYGYRINRYLEIGADVSARVGGEITSTVTDNYLNVDMSTGDVLVDEPMSTEYRNTLNNSIFAGLHIKFVLPLSENFDLYASAGATYGQVKHDSYYNTEGDGFYDHRNGVTNAEDFLAGVASGRSLCQLTGDETLCGTPIQNYQETFNEVSPTYGVGLRWKWYDSGAMQIINVGARSLFDKNDFQVISYGINYEYSF